MNEQDKKVIKIWSLLRKAKALPQDLDLKPEDILSSDVLRLEVFEAYDKKVSLDEIWRGFSEKERVNRKNEGGY